MLQGRREFMGGNRAGPVVPSAAALQEMYGQIPVVVTVCWSDRSWRSAPTGRWTPLRRQLRPTADRSRVGSSGVERLISMSGRHDAGVLECG